MLKITVISQGIPTVVGESPTDEEVVKIPWLMKDGISWKALQEGQL